MTPRSVVVCGAPRSGTSMMAQVLVDAGHRTSDWLVPASPSNPHGFHEDVRVNRVNDALLASVIPVEGTELPRHLWWLGAYDGATEPWRVDATHVLGLIPPAPFVVKDPRFSHTLPSWRHLLTDVVVVVMVRPPGQVAQSLRTMIDREPHSFVDVDTDDADVRRIVGAMWTSTYRSVLSWADDATYFVEASIGSHPDVLRGLSSVLGVELTTAAVDPGLQQRRGFHGVDVDTSLQRDVTRRLAHDTLRLVGSRAGRPSAG